MIKTRLKQFIRCHKGDVNRALHAVGFTLVGWGVWDKSLTLALSGAVTQELGHFYQYAKTRDFKDSPFYCFKPQALFAYPIFILIIIYITLAKA